jgi:hypothetical protein
MLHEVQLKHLVVVDGIGKLLLSAFSNIEGVLAHQRGNLM